MNVVQLFSFHANLKTNYLNGKVNRRVDFLIDALLRIEKDCFFKVAQKERLGAVNKKEIKEEYRHERGLKIKPEDVTVSDTLHKFFCKNLAIFRLWTTVIGL